MAHCHLKAERERGSRDEINLAPNFMRGGTSQKVESGFKEVAEGDSIRKIESLISAIVSETKRVTAAVPKQSCGHI